jgi:hypothetical protein
MSKDTVNKPILILVQVALIIYPLTRIEIGDLFNGLRQTGHL